MGLAPNTPDKLAALAKGVLGACPYIGPILSEVVGAVIPNQRIDRIVTFVQGLEARVSATEQDLARFRIHLGCTEGVDLLEEGLMQAARAVTMDRQERLSNLVATGLTAEELQYAEAKKMLNLLRELTDPEVLWLTYYSIPPTSGSDFHAHLARANPDVLAPVSSSLSASTETLDRGALQQSYKNTLLRLGLLDERDSKGMGISHLGKMLMRYIGVPEPKPTSA